MRFFTPLALVLAALSPLAAGESSERVLQEFAVPRGAPRHLGSPTPVPKALAQAAQRVFESLRRTNIRLVKNRMGVAPPTDTAFYESKIADLKRVQLEVVPSNDLRAEWLTDKVRVSTGLLGELSARSKQMLEPTKAFQRLVAIVVGQHLSYVRGFKTARTAEFAAERLYFVSPLRKKAGTLSNAEFLTAAQAFERPITLPQSRGQNVNYKVRSLSSYLANRGRLKDLAATQGGANFPWHKYRRPADGTINWKKLVADQSFQQAKGALHFGLSLFLKEIAVVGATGDRARIEEFFEGLLTTDFYTEYGLFVVGAQLGNAAYMKFLQGSIKPGFVHSLLRTQFVLAAGLALPRIVDGTIEGRTFAISLASLGLSASAVAAGASGIQWVKSLKRAPKTVLHRAGIAGTRIARLGGWFYTAGEMAIVLYLADHVEAHMTRAIELHEAREKLAQANMDLLKAVHQQGVALSQIQDSLRTNREAWTAFRNYLYEPLFREEAVYAKRIQKVAAIAKNRAAVREMALEKLRQRHGLRERLGQRSIEDYVAQLVRRDARTVQERVEAYTASFLRNQERELQRIYFKQRRPAEYLAEVADLAWHLGGQRVGADDPWRGRTDPWTGLARGFAKEAFVRALGQVSANRLQTYEDEALFLKGIASGLRSPGGAEAAELVRMAESVAREIQARDRALMGRDGVVERLRSVELSPTR